MQNSSLLDVLEFAIFDINKPPADYKHETWLLKNQAFIQKAMEWIRDYAIDQQIRSLMEYLNILFTII
jgi:hypothetical protein